jgi:hypothetical protein
MTTRRKIELSEKDIIRFWAKVDKNGPNGCWLWTAAKLELGYGIFMMPDNVTLRAPRIAWTLANGPIPGVLDTCHRCDNPPCVNPSHLFLGTRFDNLSDAGTKGRCTLQRYPHLALGMLNNSAKLNNDQVRIIRKKEQSISEASKTFGVSITIIKRVRNRTLWGHVKD